MQEILEANDSVVSVPPKNQNDTGEEETPNEEESSPPVFVHLSDSIFQANFETVDKNQHPYNTRSKVQNKSSPETSKNMVSKKPKQIETTWKHVSLDLEYDLDEDLKKLRSNRSIFELLKFPLILQGNYPVSKKSTENVANKMKEVVSKK